MWKFHAADNVSFTNGGVTAERHRGTSAIVMCEEPMKTDTLYEVGQW